MRESMGRLRAARKRYERWNQNAEERRMIRHYGGNPDKRRGADGSRRNRPLEVKSARKDHRYRINQGPHRNLVRNGGQYIFVSGGRSKVVSARKVSKLLGRGSWHKDRRYPHRFLDKSEVW